MNNLMSRKKKYRFQVEVTVEELQHVPFLCQELYVKVRSLNGGFTSQSQSVMVENHSVHWDESFKFCSKMTANASTGELDSCICRVSVRQEMKGGRSFQKLGYADVNLAQFAGSGGSNCYLLEAYDSKHRLHNSTLRVTVDMTLLSGDPCFKAQPWPRPLQPPTIEGPSEVNSDSRIKLESGSVGSLPSLGYNSLDKKAKADEQDAEQNEQNGHSRNSSNTSGSGYASNSDKSGGHARERRYEKYEYQLAINKMKSLLRRRKNDDATSIISRKSSHSLIICSSSSCSSSSSANTLSCISCESCSSPSVKVCNALNNHLNNLPLASCLENLPLSQCLESCACPNKSFLLRQNGSEVSLRLLPCSRSGSQGSGGTYSEGGSLERPVNSGRGKSSLHADNNKDPRVVSTREDAHDMIDQIFQDTIGTIKPDDSAETSGLQLYINQDGTASVSGHTIRSSDELKPLKPIIISKR